MSNIVEYSGLPKEPNEKEELTRWQKFLIFFLPWAEKKIKGLDALAEAKIHAAILLNQQTQANIDKMQAETALITADADKKKWEAITERMKAEKMIQSFQEGKATDIKAQIIEEKEQDALDKIQKLSLLGGRILQVSVKNASKVKKSRAREVKPEVVRKSIKKKKGK